LKKEVLEITRLLICLVFVFSLIPNSAAVVVWADDFNDGNYNGWTVEEGEWDASTYALKGVPGPWIIRIWHPSTQTTGTWSFDLLNIVDGPDEAHGDFYCRYNFHFMSAGCTTSPGCNISGYSVQIVENAIYILRYDEYDPILLKFNIIDGLWGTQNHIDITRDDTGTIRVYVNATSSPAVPVVEAVDTTYDISEKVVLDLLHNNWPYFPSEIDNIVVDDEIYPLHLDQTTTTTEPSTTMDTETPTEPGSGESFDLDPLLLAFGGGTVLLLAVVVVIIKRK